MQSRSLKSSQSTCFFLLLLVDRVGLVVLVKYYIICQTSLHHVFASTTCSPISVSEFSSLGKMERLSDKNEGWSEWRFVLHHHLKVCMWMWSINCCKCIISFPAIFSTLHICQNLERDADKNPTTMRLPQKKRS